jgi:UDP-N-acetylmuramate dehydrogenase
VGGPADAFVRAESIADIATTLAAAGSVGMPVFVLGGGTNLLVSDRGVRGVVLTLGRAFDYAQWSAEAEQVTVSIGAATRVGRIVRRAVAAGLGGLETAEGIPGTVGGGLLMNAGAYGVEIGELVTEVRGVTSDGRETRLGREALAFGYRHAMLPAGFVVTEVGLRLQRAPRLDLRQRMLAARTRREQSQPKGHPSAGSMFKNPPGDFAARLIEAAGLKGTRLGQVQISAKHANFFVNLGGGRAGEVRALMDLAQRRVWERFHAWLEPEVRLVGQW